MTREAGFGLAVVALIGGFAVTPAVAAEQEHEHGRASSPYIVGTWKFIPNGATPSVDTEVRFINPTNLTVTLEYAFFELDGTFCGCDRDVFEPNKTTIYTMADELALGSPLPGGPAVFSCKGNSGALKSIVFLSRGQQIFLDEASQVGFTTHVFGDIIEGDNSFLQGRVMTEAGMQPVPINEETREEIRKIHEQCVTVNGPLSP
jgi:hypothetical protein